MNDERGARHQPAVEACFRNNSFAAKNSAARGGGRVNFAGHVGSHRPLEASSSRANSSRPAPIARAKVFRKKTRERRPIVVDAHPAKCHCLCS
jgi:hypothetical protein